jgi:hypothetical protein
MRIGLPVLLIVAVCTGCTTLSTERHTTGLNGTVMDLRYREVMDDLAMVANDPNAVPSFSTMYAGTTQVTDAGQIGSTTIWTTAPFLGQMSSGYNSEAVNPLLSRMIVENWSLDPIVVPEKLEAMRCACRWVIYGPEHACDGCTDLLGDPDQSPPGTGRHFNVADKLAKLPPGWLHVGGLKDVPLKACYKAHCGKTWVWVMPQDFPALADFFLVFQDIARVDINSPTLFSLPPPNSALKFQTNNLPVCLCGLKDPSCQITAVVSIDQHGHLVPDQPYIRYRQDNTGADAHLRSAINAAASH